MLIFILNFRYQCSFKVIYLASLVFRTYSRFG